mgnify:CR=1 FL=1
MLDILYEDKDILVVVKPAGVESQTSRRLEPDMVSEIKNYLHRKVQEPKKLSTGLSQKRPQPRWIRMLELSTDWTSRCAV